MAIEQTRVIGFGAYSRQTKVLDQTRKGALESLVARGFLGRMLGLLPIGDSCLRCPMNVRLVSDISVLVIRPVVPGECEPNSTRCEIDDPTGVAEVRCLWTGCTAGFSDQRAPGLVTLLGRWPRSWSSSSV